jgi:integrase
VKTASFATVALAESRRSELWQAMRKGEAFDVDSGLPESEIRAATAKNNEKPDPRWWDFSREYMAERWRTTAAKTREGLADSLATVALAMMGEGAKTPTLEDVRLAVRWSVVPAHKEQDPPPELQAACVWLSARSLPLSALTDAKVLRDVQYRLAFKLDDTPAAGETYKPRRRGFNTAMEYAIERGYLNENPLANVKRAKHKGDDAVDPRVLVNAVQGRQLLIAVSYVGSVHRNRGRRLVVFFACQLYAAMRPAEAVGLREKDCYLPDKGWGTLTLRETRPVSGKKWTDSGKRHDKRGLKAREANTDRPVPIPPLLVAMLRAHIKEFGTAKDGRLFSNEHGDVLGTSSYWRVWQEARPIALPPEKTASPLAHRPYELRHTCITNWLNAGVPVAEVARRAGNSPEVIHRRYAGCIDGHEELNNKKIEKANPLDQKSPISHTVRVHSREQLDFTIPQPNRYRSMFGGIVGSPPVSSRFWALQRQAWRVVAASIKQAWATRNKVGFLAIAILILGTPPGGYFAFQAWRHEGDILITSLDDNKAVEIPRCLPGLEGRGTLEDGHHLWVAVEFGDNRKVFAREATMGNGKWHVHRLNVGGKGGGGQSYTLTTVDVDARTQRMLYSAVINMDDSKAATLAPREDLWRFSFLEYPSGAQPRDSVSVTRDTTHLLSCGEMSGGQDAKP